jgi:hypothetical protein
MVTEPWQPQLTADVIYIDSGPLVCPAGFYYSSPFVSLIVSDIR